MNIIEHQNIDELLAAMTTELAEALSIRGWNDPLMIGIHSGGVWVAEHLHRRLALKEALASMDISFYRDDFSRIGVNPQVKPSRLPLSIDERRIILVDDVLYTGRTIRAALNELFDYGRPAAVMLAVLVERSGRELPIQADIVGTHMQLGENQHVKLRGPEPLQLLIAEPPRRT
jgi:pyrimidine operon attenuation protein/uracil phosphoribosyltransferase